MLIIVRCHFSATPDKSGKIRIMKKRLFLISTFLMMCNVSSFGQSRLPIIDMHMHAIPATFWGTSDPDWFSKAPPRAKNDEELITQTFAGMEKYNIVLGAFSGPEQYVDRYYKNSPDRVLRGTNVFNPCDEGTIQNLRKLHAEKGYEIMGEISWQYLGIPPNDERLIPCFQLANELDIPMGIHMGMGSPGAAYGKLQYRAEAGRPLLLENRLVDFPDLRVYIMHAGWPLLDETIALMHNHPQVYADLCWINYFIPREEFYYYLKRLVNAGLGDRLMYGSDAGVWPDIIGLSIEAIEEADFLTEKQKQDIFYNNAARFLRLSENEIANHHEQ